jgi:hypothetical protein
MSGYFQPITPFHVQAVLLQSPPEQPAQSKNGGTGGSSTGGQVFGNGFGWFHLAALPLFAGLYWLVQKNPTFCTLTIFVLLACVMFRLDPSRRRLALAPITFAAIMLASRMGQYLLKPLPAVGKIVLPSDLGLTWLPLFFAISLFYMPSRPSYSGNFLIAGSVLLLAAGLLPGNGFIAVFNASQYFVFVALIIVLAVDFVQSFAPSTEPLQL